MKIVASLEDLSHEQWMEYRKKGIGGSDVGAIVGLDKYRSAFSVYLEKIGAISLADEESEAAYWGRTLEETVAAEFSKRSGLEVRTRNELLQHDTYDFMLATLDREVICPNRGIGILECKTSSEYLKEEWTGNNIPDSYYVQVQHYLAVTNYSFAYIAVLIGGNKFLYKEIERDEEVIQYLYRLEADFWNNHVLRKIPPPVDYSGSTTDALEDLYRESVKERRELSDECMEWIGELEQIKKQMKKLALRKQELENRIKHFLGEKEIGTYDGVEMITWKPTRKGHRVLKMKKAEVAINGNAGIN
ncbi:YqaJ viral recombinase family protein [Anoxybacteroides tepidamans]|uniref:YqaJ viral recombinase family nuclease n=1 Tax=Anoxybacteroides tepidamans TaxID=265948 RepID=UPI000554C0EB|nr:YqaJ viral recombinase family protein [Anoxybacillus tepidamans]